VDARLVIPLALLACLLFSLSAYVQQRTSASKPGRSGGLAGVSTLMLHLLRSPVWVCGALINLAGFLTQAVALEKGSVGLVQPLMPTQLLFAVAFAAWTARTLPTLADWVCSAAICAGVGLILASETGRAADPEAAPGKVLLVAGVAAVAIVVLLRLAHGRTPRIAAATTACAAGWCFATTAVFLKLVADGVAEHGAVALVTDPAMLGLLTTTTLGTVLSQAAFAAGPLPWAVAAMTIVNPVVGYSAGCLAFGAGPPDALKAAMAAVLLIAGVIGLVRSRSAHGWTPAVEPHHGVERRRALVGRAG
jgi:drug/metabolite transporter (DMT)-like permease